MRFAGGKSATNKPHVLKSGSRNTDVTTPKILSRFDSEPRIEYSNLAAKVVWQITRAAKGG